MLLYMLLIISAGDVSLLFARLIEDSRYKIMKVEFNNYFVLIKLLKS